MRSARGDEVECQKGDDGGAPVIVLERTPDVLATAVRTRSEGGPMAPLIVGFAAETGDATSSVLEYGRAKLARKGCEMLVVNEVGTDKVFGRDETAVTILFADGRPAVEAAGSKDEAAAAVVVDPAAPATKQRAGAALGRRDAWLARHAAEAVVVWDGEDPDVGRLVRSYRDHLGELEVGVLDPG